MQEAHTEALKRRTATPANATNTQPATRTQASQHASASSSQPATTSFRPPRAKRNSAATTNEAPGGSTSAGRGRGGYMPYFTASGNY